jgi:hypothetical protein
MASMLVPVGAQAQTAAATGCRVTDGTLSWGVKESFRSYISGTIANGSWDTADGATYESPEFQWSGATGTFDPESGTGSVSFEGQVHFTGHDGVLDLSLAQPTIEFEGDTAALLLDARSNDMEGEVAVDATQEWVGDVTLPADLQAADGALSASGAATTLTNAGVAAFAGFYEAGDELDPLSFSLTLADCDTTEAATVEAATVEEVEPVTTTAPVADEVATIQPVSVPADIPWAAIGVGGVALLVIGFTGGILAGGRRSSRRTDAPTDAAGGEQ